MKPTSRILTLLTLFALAFPPALAQTKNQQSTTTATTTPTTTIATTTPQSSGSTATTSTASNQAASKNAFQFSSDSIVLQSDPEPATSSAACGDIVDQYGNKTPIENCDNPFDPFQEEFNGELMIEGIKVSNGDKVIVPIGGSTNFYRKNKPGDDTKFCSDSFVYYKYIDGDLVYQFSNDDLKRYIPTNAEFKAYIDRKFTDQRKRDLYFKVVTYDPNGGTAPPQLTNEEQNEFTTVMNKFYKNFEASYGKPEFPLTQGTYVLVYRFSCPVPVFNDKPSIDFLEKIKNFFIPTAYAYYPSTAYSTLTFEVIEAEQEPKVSNVLFFPGIQASKLYAGEDISGVFGTIDKGEKIWTPHYNADVTALAMSGGGESIYDVYAGKILDAIPAGKSVYAGFSESLNGVPKTQMQEWAAFPYDWRYDVFDVVENGTQHKDGRAYLVQKVEALATSSKTGRVTLVGHSNGGLLIKALMMKLEEQGKADLVDKIIFIGTPHLGTPKAIGTVLHGYDQRKGFGAVIDDVVAREVIRNMPGVYNLLPSEEYVNQLNNSVISFTNSSRTHSLFSAYGAEIDSFAEFQQFLANGEKDNARSASTYYDKKSAINIPSEANSELLQRARQQHPSLDAWQPPTGVEAHSIVGVGNFTPARIRYRTVSERPCLLCKKEDILKPFVTFSKQGDETVMSLSAAHQTGETYYFDLGAYNKNEKLGLFKDDEDEEKDDVDFSHVNLTEIEPVQLLVESILFNKIFDNQYVFDTEPFFGGKYDIQAIDSPVNLFTVDQQGNRTGFVNGQVVEEIPDSEYVEFGGTKYIITPKETDTTTTLLGAGEGSYTLTLATLQGDEQTIETTFSDIPVSPQLKATYSKVDGEYTAITSDNDGDGDVDIRISLDGTITTLAETLPDVDSGGGGSTATKVRVDTPEIIVADTPATLERFEKIIALLQTAAVSPELKRRIQERLAVLLQIFIKQKYENLHNTYEN